MDEGTVEAKGDNFEGVRIYNRVRDKADWSTGLDAKNWGADEFRTCD